MKNEHKSDLAGEQNQQNIIPSRLHWVIFRYPFFVSFVALIVFIQFPQFKIQGMVVTMIALGMWVEALIRFFSRKIYVIDNAIVIQSGLFSPRDYIIPGQFITQFNITQTVPGKCLNYGNIEIHFKSESGEGVNTIDYVAHPNTLKSQLS